MKTIANRIEPERGSEMTNIKGLLMNPIETFFAVWDREAEKTVQILKTLPPGQYDFRPDPSGRSLGELAWHLAEVDAYVSFGVATGVWSKN